MNRAMPSAPLGLTAVAWNVLSFQMRRVNRSTGTWLAAAAASISAHTVFGEWSTGGFGGEAGGSGVAPATGGMFAGAAPPASAKACPVEASRERTIATRTARCIATRISRFACTDVAPPYAHRQTGRRQCLSLNSPALDEPF